MRIYFFFLIFFIVIIIILFSSASSSSFNIFLYLYISLIKLYEKVSLKWGNIATECINQPLELWIWRKYDTICTFFENIAGLVIVADAVMLLLWLWWLKLRLRLRLNLVVLLLILYFFIFFYYIIVSNYELFFLPDISLVIEQNDSIQILTKNLNQIVFKNEI